MTARLRAHARLFVRHGRRVAFGVVAALAIVGPSEAGDGPQFREARSSTVAVLNDADVETYRTIFTLQDQGQFAEASALASRLGNDSLMGYVRQREILAPGAEPKASELAAWMAAYADLPGADEVYARAASTGESIARPEPRAFRSRLVLGKPEAVSRRAPSTEARSANARIAALIKSGQPEEALDALNAARAAFGPNERDDATLAIAASYYAEGLDDEAYALASEVADRNRREVPLADWNAGLAAWRMGDIERAEPHFAALARVETANPALRAAGAFWAARADLRLRHPERVGPMLEIAAEAPRTFYGVLALRQLGRELPFKWNLPALDAKTWALFQPYPAVARAVALMQVGRPDLAETELLRVLGKLPQSLDPALLVVASKLQLSAVRAKIVESAQFEGLDGARYPVPEIVPQGGFTLDPALLYAFMHKESGFTNGATSRAGARGLMQIMPNTARHVVGGSEAQLKSKLFDPSFNLHVAQAYLKELMGLVAPHGNLYMLAVAYNGGPGNLTRWRAKLGSDDPLLFIESVPSAETRTYIECVLTNYWAYRSRLGEDLSSLDAAAAGEWPVYDTDAKVIKVGQR